MICRQMTFLGHVIRNDEMEKVVLTGYREGTRDRGKQIIIIIYNICIAPYNTIL